MCGLASRSGGSTYYPGQKNCYSQEIHEADLQFDHVISCDIKLRFNIDATHSLCASRARVADRSRCCMISDDRTADQSQEYLGCNDFFGQGSMCVDECTCVDVWGFGTCGVLLMIILPCMAKKIVTSREIHEADLQFDHVISCNIELRFGVDVTCGVCVSRVHVADQSRCRMISHDRTVDQSHEYLGCNNFFGQGSRCVLRVCLAISSPWLTIIRLYSVHFVHMSFVYHGVQ